MKQQSWRKLMAAFLSTAMLSGCVTGGGPTLQNAYFDPQLDTSKVKLPGAGKDPNKTAEELDRFSVPTLPPGFKPAKGSLEADYWFKVDRLEKKVRGAGNRITDPELNAYVSKIVCDLAGKYCPDIRIYIVRNPLFNASMAPNGMMTVHSGLLLRTTNEAQLAAVLGHEIGHYLRRHTLQRMEDLRDSSAGLVVFQFITAGLGVGILGSVAQLGVLGSVQAFSRQHEREADGYGLVLMANAGYDVREAANNWNKIIREQKREDKGSGSYYLASHPASAERSDYLKEMADEITARNGMGIQRRAEYWAAMAPYWESFFADQLSLNKFEGTDELLTMMMEEGLPKGMVQFFVGENYRTRADEGDLESAIDAYNSATRYPDHPDVLYRSRGLVNWKLGRKADARADLDIYLTRQPDDPDAVLIKQMIGGT